jgi:uncharacterized membrane protein YgdD (TMEM256/DUF423 family)
MFPDAGDNEDPEEITTWTLPSPTRRAGGTGIFVVGAGAFAGLCQVRPAAQRLFTSRSTTLTCRHGCAQVAIHTCTHQNKIQTSGFVFSMGSLVPVRSSMIRSLKAFWEVQVALPFDVAFMRV